jgi:hypothetical protein
MSCTIDRWTATATGSGEDRVIKVKGEGQCTRKGDHRFILEPANEGPRDDPDLVAVRLVIEEAEVGIEVINDVTVETEINGDPATKVRIDTPEGSHMAEVEPA